MFVAVLVIVFQARVLCKTLGSDNSNENRPLGATKVLVRRSVLAWQKMS